MITGRETRCGHSGGVFSKWGMQPFWYYGGEDGDFDGKMSGKRWWDMGFDNVGAGLCFKFEHCFSSINLGSPKAGDAKWVCEENFLFQIGFAVMTDFDKVQWGIWIQFEACIKAVKIFPFIPWRFKAILCVGGYVEVEIDAANCPEVRFGMKGGLYLI